METVGVPWDSYVLKTKAYKFIIKVRKFQLPTVYSFNTAEGETWLWVDSVPQLNRVKEVKTSKSPGYDNIPTSLIKEGAEEIAASLLFHPINSSLRESVFPTSEKCAKITPVYKSGKQSSMDNYRPISVLSVLSKVLEKVVHKQIYEFLKTNNLLLSKLIWILTITFDTARSYLFFRLCQKTYG